MTFAIAVKHDRRLSRYVRATTDSRYPATEADAWMTLDIDDAARFPTVADARAAAKILSGRFGEGGYRFRVVERQTIPVWVPINE